MAEAEAALRLEGVSRWFSKPAGRLDVLRDIELSLCPGELVALVGASGSGKSTLLHIAGLLDRPSAGHVLVGGAATGMMSDRRRTRLRGEALGFVYQFHHLLAEFTALENVALPALLAGANLREGRARAGALLERVGLAARMTHRPSRLSGGEQQRVAIARALINAPKVLLADEPTGNLDEETADQVFELLLTAVREQGAAALIATHDTALAARMDRILRLRTGALEPAAPGELKALPA
ncbi:MAG: ABC transporter ATP-binding protein [Geminicoccaceae bacterium]